MDHVIGRNASITEDHRILGSVEAKPVFIQTLEIPKGANSRAEALSAFYPRVAPRVGREMVMGTLTVLVSTRD